MDAFFGGAAGGGAAGGGAAGVNFNFFGFQFGGFGGSGAGGGAAGTSGFLFADPGGAGGTGGLGTEGVDGGQGSTGGTGGFGGYPDHGRRFDRIDAGSTGTHGAHPMSSPVGTYSGTGGTARSAAILGGLHDPHYSEWRNRQIEEFDRDYEDFRREHQSRFEQEFGEWRSKRQGQRQSLGRVSEHMEVVGSDGEHVGTVDKVRGDRIILTKGDDDSGGRHHSIPCSWIESVEDKVILNRGAEDARQAWRDEERGAFFAGAGDSRESEQSRSYAGTYEGRED